MSGSLYQADLPPTFSCWGVELLCVRAGAFVMGSPDREAERREDETPHEVRLEEDFWLGKYPVTQQQWTEVMGANPSLFKGVLSLPVDNVNWKQAMAFCARLTALAREEGLLPEGVHCTLPTEAQWEYACRGGATGPYGRPLPLDALGWYQRNSGGKTQPVGLLAPNAWGFFDMHGNVWEWCRDWYGPYAQAEGRSPQGPAEGTQRVARGGSWGYYDWGCRSAFRCSFPPHRSGRAIGLRVCLARQSAC